MALAAGRALVVHGDRRGIAALLSLRRVRESEALDVDDEDVSLLKDLSGQVLRSVKGQYKFPSRTLVPTFPENH